MACRRRKDGSADLGGISQPASSTGEGLMSSLEAQVRLLLDYQEIANLKATYLANAWHPELLGQYKVVR
jgi:hypothetical protein